MNQSKVIYLERLVFTQEEQSYRDSLLAKFLNDWKEKKSDIKELVTMILPFRETLLACKIESSFIDDLCIREKLGMSESEGETGQERAAIQTLFQKLEEFPSLLNHEADIFTEDNPLHLSKDSMKLFATFYDCISLFHRLMRSSESSVPRYLATQFTKGAIPVKIGAFQKTFIDGRATLP